ncbi:hypothetical protein [Schlesneria sp. DSM 10557]|uniref:hypothetical protein n=1 Tax=Schlesneria sp. DSM 10557 TaxID=3044399 RepID=UPI0035A07BC8
MSLSLDLAAALNPLVGQTFVPPKTVSVSDASGLTIAVDLISVESLGVACEELSLTVPALGAATLDTLKKWASDLCRRVTYLLENIGPLEFDAQGQQVMIRSTPPDTTTTSGTRYYEVILSLQGGGQFSLRRYHNDGTGNGRTPVPLQITHEQLSKLVNDLLATIPTNP